MGNVVYIEEVTYNVTCHICGTQWLMVRSIADELEQANAEFACPNGHQVHFLPDTQQDATRAD